MWKVKIGFTDQDSVDYEWYIELRTRIAMAEWIEEELSGGMLWDENYWLLREMMEGKIVGKRSLGRSRIEMLDELFEKYAFMEQWSGGSTIRVDMENLET